MEASIVQPRRDIEVSELRGIKEREDVSLG